MSGIFDSGWARRLLDTLGRYGEVEALVTGTTGTTALLDARMEGEIRIIRGRWSAWPVFTEEAMYWVWGLNFNPQTQTQRSSHLARSSPRTGTP